MAILEQGTYKAHATMGALGYTSTGKEQVAVEFRIDEGPEEGRRLTWYGFFTEKTTDRTLESLRRCGWEGDDISDLTGIDRNQVELVIEHEDDMQGNARARVKWINGAGGLVMKERMEGQALRTFAAKMKGKAVASRGVASAHRAPAKAPPKRNAEPEDVDESEIPF